MKLPEAFKNKMLKLLGESEYGELIKALNGQRQYGLRVNTLKVSVDEFLKMSPFNMEAVPWTADGFYISEEDMPGKHPYYYAGLYYIQEPSAMLPGVVLDAQPGEKVLDLCAAPGGKTLQIAAAMKGQGLLFSNDINADRVKALVKNIELCGVRNAIVLNESPVALASRFEGYFDRVLIDAPCSGEGMFRKDEAAARSWEKFKCERCAKIQEELLECADRLLKPGGTLVYSTCTFSPEENEQMVINFIRKHGGYELAEIPKTAGIEGGRPQWVAGIRNKVKDGDGFSDDRKNPNINGTDDKLGDLVDIGDAGDINEICDINVGNKVHDNSNDLCFDKISAMTEKMARLWPHRVRGEGHFVAKLVKVGITRKTRLDGKADESGNSVIIGNEVCYDGVDDNFSCERFLNAKKLRNIPSKGGRAFDTVENVSARWRNVPAEIPYEELPSSFHEFIDENIVEMPKGYYFTVGRNLYCLPEPPPALNGLKVAKFGWFLGSFEDDRFEPSHSFVTALDMKSLKRAVSFDAGSEEVRRYLKGETLVMEGEKGYIAVCVDGYTLGWTKQTGGMLKNLYPKGWRKLN